MRVADYVRWISLITIVITRVFESPAKATRWESFIYTPSTAQAIEEYLAVKAWTCRRRSTVYQWQNRYSTRGIQYMIKRYVEKARLDLTLSLYTNFVTLLRRLWHLWRYWFTQHSKNTWSCQHYDDANLYACFRGEEESLAGKFSLGRRSTTFLRHRINVAK